MTRIRAFLENLFSLLMPSPEDIRRSTPRAERERRHYAPNPNQRSNTP